MAKLDPSTRNSLPPGTRFGRYEVIAEIASGGMATVYLGRALGAAGFQRQVAIKVMHPHVAKDDEFVTMFMDEARLAARLRHPNAVPTLDLENGEDGLFLVMEYVEGDVLTNLMRSVMRDKRQLPVPIVLRIVLDVLNGLHAAHELTGDRGEPLRLVHRDVSPHNVLVGVDGICRITDFGIARADERMGTTRDGQIKGKLAYMAPEQTSGNPVDRRADLFAVGVVLWECLTGRRLFKGENDGEVLRNLLVNPIPHVREIVPELPEALDAVCAKALERDPDQRFATAAHFAEALEEAGGSIGIASARAVSKQCLEVSGTKVNSLQARARQMSTDGLTGPNSAIRSRNRLTDPDQTVRRDDTDVRNARRGPLPVSTGESASVAAGATAPAVSNDSPDLVLEDPKRVGRKYVAIAAVAFIAALSIGGWVLFAGHQPPSAAPPVHPPTIAAAPNPASPTAVSNPPPSGTEPAAGAPEIPGANVPHAGDDTVPTPPSGGPATASADHAHVARPQQRRGGAHPARGGNGGGHTGGGYNPESM